MFDWFKPTKPPTKLQLLLTEIEGLKSTINLNPYSSDISMKTVLVYFTTIISYINALKLYHDAVCNNTIIGMYSIPSKATIVSIREFFIHNNRFVDVDNELEILLDYMSLVVKWYDEHLDNKDEIFSINKNLLLLQPIIANIELLVGSLRDA